MLIENFNPKLRVFFCLNWGTENVGSKRTLFMLAGENRVSQMVQNWRGDILVSQVFIVFSVQMNFREQEPEKRQLTIFYGGKVLVFNDFPADKAKGLMQLASKGSTVAPQNAVAPAPAAVTDNTKAPMAVPAPVSSLPTAQADAQKPARANASGNYSALS